MQSGRRDKSTQLHPLQLMLHNALLKVMKHAARQAGQGRSHSFATDTMQSAQMITFCESSGEKNYFNSYPSM